MLRNFISPFSAAGTVYLYKSSPVNGKLWLIFR